MDDKTRTLLQELADGKVPGEVPHACEYAEELRALVAHVSELQAFALGLSKGDLSNTPQPCRGPAMESLKVLQANLRHLTWQAQRIADGDLDQRAEFMEDFALAFNNMVGKLADARTALVHTNTHDELTGLFNRAFFDAELDRIARGRQFPISLVVVDIDGLKPVNDSEGHAQGDLLILKAAKVLRMAFRAEDVVARTGGDEFAVLLPGVDEPIGKRIVERLAQQCELANREEDRHLSLSVGLGTARSRKEVRPALQQAEERMYADKAARKAERST